MNPSALEILTQLAAIDSTATTGELGCAAKIQQIFASFGVESHLDCWDDNRANISATVKGSGDEPALMFASHLDVVPVNPELWQNQPFTPTIRDGKLYGRGTVDMKGGMAAVMAATAELLSEGNTFRRDFIFAATAGEETDSVGVYRYLDANPQLKGKLAGVVVPEPTSMNLAIAHRGILWLEISFHGKPAHGSMPHLGVNAIEHAFLLHQEMLSLGLEQISDPLLGNCTVSCNRLNAGEAINIVPDMCKVCYDIRLIHGIDKGDILQKVEAVMQKIKAQVPEFNATVEILRQCPALYTQSNTSFVEKVAKICHKQPTVVGYTTDSPYFAKLDAPVIVMGPGEAGMCHQIDEYICIDELEQAKSDYKKLISDICC